MADAAATGVLQGKTITLDAPVPPLDGQRVSVIIAPLEEGAELSAPEQQRFWDEWITQGPQGPIEDEEEPEFP
ncbi:MAG TPA: hypothetical protein VI072_18410 [Polyangiaceae bacterium]